GPVARRSPAGASVRCGASAGASSPVISGSTAAMFRAAVSPGAGCGDGEPATVVATSAAPVAERGELGGADKPPGKGLDDDGVADDRDAVCGSCDCGDGCGTGCGAGCAGCVVAIERRTTGAALLAGALPTGAPPAGAPLPGVLAAA